MSGGCSACLAQRPRRAPSATVGGLLGCSLVALLLAGSGRRRAQPSRPRSRTTRCCCTAPRPQVRATRARRSPSSAPTACASPRAGRRSRRRRAPAQARRRRSTPSDSRTYPRGRLDRARPRGAGRRRRRAWRSQIDLAFWAPRWAVAQRRRAARRASATRPTPTEFARFAERRRAALLRRASPTRAARHATLPAVRLYTTWNEPNHPSFLAPQWKRDAQRRLAARTRRTSTAPMHERGLRRRSRSVAAATTC